TLRLRGALLRRHLLGEIAPARQRIRHLLKRGLDRTLVVCNGGVAARLGDRERRSASAEVEQRQGDRRAETPGAPIVADQFLQLGGSVAVRAGQRDRRQECGARRADVGARRAQALLRRDDVGTRRQKLRGQTGRQRLHARLLLEARRRRERLLDRSADQRGQQILALRVRQAQRRQFSLGLRKQIGRAHV